MAVVTDGSAVFGLGNVGHYAALPVMEGKAALFKRFADIDAWPICLDSQDTEEIVRIVTDDMLIATAQALADVVSPDEIGPHYIIPSVFHPDVASSVPAVRDAATQQPGR